MMPAWPGAPPPSNMPPQWQNMQQTAPQPYFWPNQGNFPIPGPQMQPNQNVTNQNDSNKEILNPKNPEEEHKLVSLQMQAQQWQQQKQMQEWLGNQNPQQQSTKIDSTPIMSAEMIKAKNDKLQELNTVKKEEEEFDKQYREWEKQFEQWKDQNKDHPNKDQFKQYEEQWNQWKSQMNDKRTEILSKKSAVEKALAALTPQQPPIQNPFQQTAPLSYGQYPGMPQPNNMIPQQPGIPPVPYNQQGGGAYPNNPMASNPQGTMMPGPYQNMGGGNYQPQPPLGPQPPSSLMYGGGVNSNPNMPGMNPAMPHPRAGDGMSGMQNIYGSHQQPPGNQNSYNGVNANASNQIPSYNVGPGGNMNPNLGPNPINQRNQPATNPFTYGGSTANLPQPNDGRNQQKSFNNDRDGTFQFQRSTREEDYDYDDSLNDTATDYGNSDYRDGNTSSAPFNDNTQTMMPPGGGHPHQQSFDYGGKGDMGGGGGSFYNGSQQHPHPSRFGGPPIGSDYHPGRPGPAFPPRPRPAYPRGPGINSYSGGGGMMGASRMPPPHARAPFNGASANAMRNEGINLPPYIATGAGDRGSESSSSLQRERKKSSRWGEPVDTNEDSTSATQVNSYPKDSSRHDQGGHLENDGGDGDPKLGLLGEAPDRGYGSGGGGMRPNPAMMMRMMMMNRGGGMMGGPPAGPMAAAANMMRAMMMMRARGAMMAGRGGGSGPPFFAPHPRGPGGFGPRRGFHHHDRRDHGGYGHRGGGNRDGRRSRSRSPHPHDGHGRGENDPTDDRNGADEDKSGPGAWNRNAKDGSGGGPRGDGGLSATPRMGTPNKMLPGGGPHNNDMGMMGRPRHMQNYGYQNQQGRRSGDYPDES